MKHPARPGAADIEALRRDLLIEQPLLGAPMRFTTTWGLFSPRAIDEGSRLLLDHLSWEAGDRVLDLGCGYGALGLSIARQVRDSGGHCTLVDKDFVAVEYARRNAALNGLDNVDVLLSNGLDQIRERRFSLAVTNLPAKTSNEQYTLFFHDIHRQLEPGGRCYVVVINGLRQLIARLFGDIFGNHKKLKQGKTYTVARAIKHAPPTV